MRLASRPFESALRVVRRGENEMLPRAHISSVLMKRSLASVVVLSLSFMSFAVSNCEISCLFDDVHCAGALAQSSPSVPMDPASMEMGMTPEHAHLAARTGASSSSGGRRLESASCSSGDLCKDASASAMLPTARTEFQKVRWMAIDVVVALNRSTRECLGDKAEYPPPKAIAPNLLSINLRI
jgi:hypothetical protein